MRIANSQKASGLGILTTLFLCCACESPVSTKAEDAPATSDTTGSTDENWQDTDTCANLDLSLAQQPVTLLLVIDHSASMDLQLGDNDTRWSVLVKALMGTTADPGSGLIRQLEAGVRFGMMLFTAVRNEPETCPILVTVAPKQYNGETISTIFRADDETYKGASPVPEAVLAAIDLLHSLPGPGRRVILLATDGMPQTCASLARLDDVAGRDATVASVQSAWNEGIATFVVGVGDESSDAHLQQVANAGVGISPTGDELAGFYRGSTENRLVDALDQVLRNESRSCVYELSGKGVAAGEESSGQVVLNGEVLEFDNPGRGWRLKSPSEIELLGEACDSLQFGDQYLQAHFPCEAIILID